MTGQTSNLQHPGVEVATVHYWIITRGVDSDHEFLDGGKVGHGGAAGVVRELEQRRGFAHVPNHPPGGAAVPSRVELPLAPVADIRHGRRHAREVDLVDSGAEGGVTIWPGQQ